MPIIERIDAKDAKGVEGIRVGRFSGKVNTTVFLYRHGSTLIDTGPPNQWSEVEAFAREKPVELVIATHHHEDHAGNLAALSRRAGVPALAPTQSLDFLIGGFPIQPYRRLVWGRPDRVEPDLIQAIPAFPDHPASPSPITLPEGGTLEPILLPGHSPDMTCLLDRERGLLFAADLYIARRLRYLRRDEDLGGMIASLERALSYDFDILLCGHRGVIHDGKARLKEKLDILTSLREEARELRRRGLGLRAITRRLLGREGGMVVASLGHFSKKNLIRACLA